jgi:hypothetical protein
MAQLEALDGVSESIVASAGRVVGAERRAARGSRCQKNRRHFDGGGFDGSSFMATLRRCCAPDQHMAWRSNRLRADPLALINRVRGAAN